MKRSPLCSALLGAGLGLGWGAGWRSWMAVLAGEASSFTWSGTFAGILLPATLVGASLGWAEHVRLTGAAGVWRWTALTPLLFVAMPALVQNNFVAQLRTGLGTGAIATALIGMIGGFAIAGRGPRWARILARILMAALLAATIAGAFVGSRESRLRATTPTGAFLVITFVVFSGLLAGACARPHLPVKHEMTTAL